MTFEIGPGTVHVAPAGTPAPRPPEPHPAASSTDQVLATIDQALDDWTVSGDAMRWTPVPPAPPSPWVQIGHLGQEFIVSFDGVNDDTRLWSVATRPDAPHTPTLNELGAVARQWGQRLALAFEADLARFTAAMNVTGDQLALLARAFNVPLSVLTGDAHHRRRRHAVRMAYRRRQLARRRR